MILSRLPEQRPTARALLDHDFCVFDATQFNFREYKARAILKKREMDQEDEEDSDEDDSSPLEGLSPTSITGTPLSASPERDPFLNTNPVESANHCI